MNNTNTIFESFATNTENESPENSAAKAELESKVAWVRKQYELSIPADGTTAETYLNRHRKLEKPWPNAIRWSPAYQHEAGAKIRPCLLSVVTNNKDEVVALQSLELDTATGTKAGKVKSCRFSNGPVGEGAVRLTSSNEETASLVIGEGIETVMTRNMVSPCESYACLGALRYIEPKKHHKRVEILADNDKRDEARRLAKRYAEKGLSACVITVSELLGPKADLNDMLQQSGLSAVRMAVEDAEIFSTKTRNGLSDFDLEIGSDVEIAQRILERLEEIYGTIVVCEGKVWRFDRTHWVAFDNDNLARFVHRADGAQYISPAGKTQTVKLNKNRVASILDALFKYRQDASYFKELPFGINCESGFIQLANDGSVEHLPHARKWRQRHLVYGQWQGDEQPEKWEGSNLARYLQEAVAEDVDAAQKIELLGEVAGCAATGRGTKIKNPKAIVLFSEEGGTGKSTFLRLLRAMPNASARASVPAGKFGDEKFAFQLVGKVLNAVDELPDRAIRSDVFKRMITGEPVPARDLYCSAIDFEPVALHVFSTNVLPAFSGGIDGGTARRLLPIEFTHIVPVDQRDYELPDKIIRQEADLLLYFAVAGAQRLFKNGDFTVPASSKDLLSQWLINSDAVRAWAAVRLEVTEEESVIAVSAMYANFRAWAAKQGLKADFLPSNISFGKRLRTAVPQLESHRSDGSYYKNARLKPEWES